MKVSKKMSATKRYRVIMDMNNLKMVMHNLSVEWRDNATLCAAVVRNCCITIFFNDKTHVEALLVLFIYPAINAIVATFRRCLRTNMEISWCYRPKKNIHGFCLWRCIPVAHPRTRSWWYKIIRSEDFHKNQFLSVPDNEITIGTNLV